MKWAAALMKHRQKWYDKSLEEVEFFISIYLYPITVNLSSLDKETYGIPELTSSALRKIVFAWEQVTLHMHSWFKYKIKSPARNRPSLATTLFSSICRITVPHNSYAKASSWMPIKRRWLISREQQLEFYFRLYHIFLISKAS